MSQDKKTPLFNNQSIKSSNKTSKEIICLCNNIDRATIEAAIRNGATTLNQIFDSTTAGVGPCGGSCRRKLAPLLEHYLKSGEFPEATPTPMRKPKTKPSKKNRKP